MFTADNIVLYAALAVGVLLVVEGVYQLAVDVSAGPRAQINRRLRMLAEDPSDPRAVLRSLLRDTGGSRLARFVPTLGQLERLLVQAGVSIRVGRLLGLVGGVASPPSSSCGCSRPRHFGTATAAAVAVAVLPTALFLLVRRGRRTRRFEEQLPDALDLLVRSLRVGHPLSSALNVVATEMPDPVGTEFGVAVDEITYGAQVPDALERMTQRLDLQDLRYFVVVVSIQYNSGGNLAEVLSELCKVIRERFQMFRKVRAITADGRISAWFLSIFPVAMIFLIQVIKPDYYTQVADHPMFRTMVIVTFVLLAVNILAMRLMTNFKV
jgi:tight adherence protein B